MRSIIKYYYFNYIKKYKLESYSQEGEDRFLERIFEGQKNGFYIDIGAHHPFRFSNTYLFYKKGWRGINIDANPNSISLFNKFRKLDKNINIGIGNSNSEMIFYKFKEAALSSFDKNLSNKRISEGWELESEMIIKVTRLRDILKNVLNSNQVIDFMNIDVEGLDFEVLQSNDWDIVRPKIVMVECLNENFDKIFTNEIYLYLEKLGYEFLGKTHNTCFFKRLY